MRRIAHRKSLRSQDCESAAIAVTLPETPPANGSTPVTKSTAEVASDMATNSMDPSSIGFVAIGFIGVVVCISWFKLIESYRKLNKAKWDVINEMEPYLPLRMYGREWAITSSIEYESLSGFEKWVPVGLALGYVVMFGLGVAGMLD